MTAMVDHLVVAAASLEQGAAWCETTLGCHTRSRRQTSEHGHAQPADGHRQHGLPDGLSGNHRRRSAGATAPAAALVRPGRCGAADPAARAPAAAARRGAQHAARRHAGGAARAGPRRRPGRGRRTRQPDGAVPLAHCRPRRWPTAVRRRAAHADRVAGHAPERTPAAQRRGAALAGTGRSGRGGRDGTGPAWRVLHASGVALRAAFDTPRGRVQLSSDD